ncbi:hypothetical protein MMC21_007581 [Puttea exsequens]|nr:hypothetical protein [Puttea exsequens]
MPLTVEPVSMSDITDWDGRIISRQMVRYLSTGCIVRLIIRSDQGAEAIYFEITKIKDGTFWGVAQDTYRFDDIVGLPNGHQMTFKKQHINEIPLLWQPKQYRKAVGHLARRTKDFGYFPTGVREV